MRLLLVILLCLIALAACDGVGGSSEVFLGKAYYNYGKLTVPLIVQAENHPDVIHGVDIPDCCESLTSELPVNIGKNGAVVIPLVVKDEDAGWRSKMVSVTVGDRLLRLTFKNVEYRYPE